jgi:hypothetical protein
MGAKKVLEGIVFGTFLAVTPLVAQQKAAWYKTPTQSMTTEYLGPGVYKTVRNGKEVIVVASNLPKNATPESMRAANRSVLETYAKEVISPQTRILEYNTDANGMSVISGTREKTLIMTYESIVNYNHKDITKDILKTRNEIDVSVYK